MKIFLLITVLLCLHYISNCQDDKSLQSFLNTSTTQILKESVDSLKNELEKTKGDLESKEKELESTNYNATESIKFLLFLEKLETNQKLASQDSAFIDRIPEAYMPDASDSSAMQNAEPQKDIIYITIWNTTLYFLNQNDSLSDIKEYPFLNAFVNLKKLYLEHKLIIHVEIISAMEAPEILLPPQPHLSLTSSSIQDKKAIAGMWLNYINQISQLCSFLPPELKKYYTIEKSKVPDGNLDKLIDLRQKCAMFIQKNYCHK